MAVRRSDGDRSENCPRLPEEKSYSVNSYFFPRAIHGALQRVDSQTVLLPNSFVRLLLSPLGGAYFRAPRFRQRNSAISEAKSHG
jgi:hypothetical protein